MSEHVERQYFKSYLAMIHNSVGSEMFRSFYVRINGGPVTDAIRDGENACAFFVTSVLLIFGKQKSIHATVVSAVKDLEASGWERVDEDAAVPGDVLVWAERDDESRSQHIGFFVGDGDAISTSSSQRKVTRHDMHFGQLQRAIIATYHMRNW